VTFLNLHDQYREIHGIDLTASVDEIAAFFRRKGIETYLHNGSVLAMPYDDNTFDSVLLISILEHLQPGDQIKAFSEITRVLKPGGQVVYGVPIERPAPDSRNKHAGSLRSVWIFISSRTFQQELSRHFHD
jgi:ubiquinone/menaquinone biosynthesis C-methylase UbiE